MEPTTRSRAIDSVSNALRVQHYAQRGSVGLSDY